MSIYPPEQFADVPGRPGLAARVLVGPEHGVTSFFLVEDRLEPSTEIPLHTHPVDEVVVVQEGQLAVDLGPETHLVPHGHTVVIPPGTPHRLANRGAAPVQILVGAAWNRATFYAEASHYLEGEPRG